METPEELQGALRQFKHNTGEDGFIFGFDHDETIRVFGRLRAELETMTRDRDEYKNAMHISETRRGADDYERAELRRERDALRAQIEEMQHINQSAHEQYSLMHPVHQVWFRAGLLACREYMARFVESESPAIAQSIRANWWPDLGADPGAPRLNEWGELTEGEYGESGFRVLGPDEVSPSIEALPIAFQFLMRDLASETKAGCQEVKPVAVRSSVRVRGCKWTENDDGVWETQCGNVFVLIEGTPLDNNMRFCCYCGDHIIEAPESGDEEE